LGMEDAINKKNGAATSKTAEAIIILSESVERIAEVVKK